MVNVQRSGTRWPSETIVRCIAVLPEHLQLLKVVLHSAKIAACPGISWPINADIIMLDIGPKDFFEMALSVLTSSHTRITLWMATSR
jgi:hypothetical protein